MKKVEIIKIPYKPLLYELFEDLNEIPYRLYRKNPI